MEDSAILDLFWNRSETAIRVLDENHGAAARRLAMNFTASAEDAEECVSDAYLRLWQSIPPKRPEHLRAYFFCTVRNLALKKLRARNTEKRGGGCFFTELSELFGQDGETETTAAPDVADLRALADTIDRFLQSLSAEDRRLFLRRYYMGESVKALAASSSSTENRISVRLSRLRDRLKKQLDEEGIVL